MMRVRGDDDTWPSTVRGIDKEAGDGYPQRGLFVGTRGHLLRPTILAVSEHVRNSPGTQAQQETQALPSRPVS